MAYLLALLSSSDYYKSNPLSSSDCSKSNPLFIFWLLQEQSSFHLLIAKVRTFWEANKIWKKNLPHAFDVCSVNVQSMRKISFKNSYPSHESVVIMIFLNMFFEIWLVLSCLPQCLHSKACLDFSLYVHIVENCWWYFFHFLCQLAWHFFLSKFNIHILFHYGLEPKIKKRENKLKQVKVKT